ncbi:hypothetical protein [Sphingomonas sp. SRS2]|uniref:hypothetical protein n=1 Tax=Sphingomonas sp. SRS2 TaxID=133190 RepID=UPI0006184E99|nr:hypothetical protein [Sphingomonas sp. SRS2]KKC25797.1 hypothetical protein WP12_12125 [Sphingomonas sp. SRS2]
MGVHDHDSIIPAQELPYMEAFDALSDREALRLIKRQLQRFSGCSIGYDKADYGVDLIAVDLAEQEDWRGEDLAARYLADTRIPPAYERHVMVSGAAFYGKQFGG